MTCKDEIIKDLLPAYREEALEEPELALVRAHLESCEDCRGELALLGLLAADSVPDPGEEFWAAMPERVYRAVRGGKEREGRSVLSRIVDRFILPRWAWAAAAAGIVLLVAWVALLAPLKRTERLPSAGYDVSEEIITEYPSPAELVQMQISELDRDELDTADAWAGNELASIGRDIERGMGSGVDADLYVELSQLDAREVERLSKMIDRWNQEG